LVFLAFVSPISGAVPEINTDGVQQSFFPLLVAPAFSERNEDFGIRSEPPSPAAIRAREETKARILKDFASRIAPEFWIPDGLYARASFWFDVYTLYGNNEYIIHHVRYPWIIFKVIDTKQLLTNGKGPLWLRRERGEKLAESTANEIRRALQRLAKRKSYDHLTQLEQTLFDKLKEVNGPRRTVFRQAAGHVRTQLGQRDFFKQGLANSSRYLAYMEEEFRRLGLPTEVTRLPFVESSFNENARSKVGASGIWQIMPQTGKSYLIVNDTIDERNSPIKATIAAGRLLRSYFRALGGSWPLTLTSYNNGIGNIQKAIKGARSRDLSEIVERYHQGDFRFASSNFFTCFLAALYAEKYHELIFNDVAREPLQEREWLALPGKTQIYDLMKLTGLEKSVLLQYNLDLRASSPRHLNLPRGYQIHLPVGFKSNVLREIGTNSSRSATRRRG